MKSLLLLLSVFNELCLQVMAPVAVARYVLKYRTNEGGWWSPLVVDGHNNLSVVVPRLFGA